MDIRLVLFAVSIAANVDPRVVRKTTSADLSVPVERVELANGMVVLLSPDASSHRLAVESCFRAGALSQAANKGGLAHLVEHLLGADSPQLEARGARNVNAYTTPAAMCFTALFPAEELPAALFFSADRIARGPQRFEQSALDRERRVIAEERNEVSVDVPYGRIDEAIDGLIFSPAHPLHGSVIGAPAELGHLTLEDARSFAQRYITASNAVLTLAGRFDPAVAREWIGKTVAVLPAMARPTQPKLPWSRPERGVVEYEERRGRQPRVTVIWKLGELTPTVRDALELGADVLSQHADGAYGTRVGAALYDQGGQAYFRLDVLLAHDKPIESAENEAEAFLRMLTGKDTPRDDYEAARLGRDRDAMFAIDFVSTRARLLAAMELDGSDPTQLARVLERHWSFARHDVQHFAWKSLVIGAPRLIIHARPTRPLQPKIDYEDLDE